MEHRPAKAAGSHVLKEMDGFGSMDSDILFEVLSRLSTKELCEVKCISKAWQSLISDRTFIKVQAQNREPISGFFIQQKLRYSSFVVRTISYIPVATKETVELQQSVFNFLSEDVGLLASCNGLLCCCSFGRDPCLYICNPLKKEFLRLNLNEPGKGSNIALAFNPCREPIHTTTNFRLVRVQRVANGFLFEVFSSSTGAWKKSRETCWCPSKLNRKRNKGIYIEGILHWQTSGDKILTFDLTNELSWLVSIPVPASRYRIKPKICIGESNNKLHYVTISEYGLQVWLLEDYFESRWSLECTKSLEELEEDHPEFFSDLLRKLERWKRMTGQGYIDPLAFKDGYLMIRVNQEILQYNVKANKIQSVCNISQLGSPSVYFSSVLPYSPSLVPL